MVDDTSGDHSAKDNILKNSKITVVTLPSVENVQGFDGASNPDRTSQQQILSNAVKPRFLNTVQDFPNIVTLNTPVPTGASVIFNNIVNNSSANLIVEFLHFQIYIGQVAPANAMPQSIGSGNYPFYTFNPLYNPINGISIDTTQSQVISTVQIRNNSGSIQNIYVQFYTRYIGNQAAASQPH